VTHRDAGVPGPVACALLGSLGVSRARESRRREGCHPGPGRPHGPAADGGPTAAPWRRALRGLALLLPLAALAPVALPSAGGAAPGGAVALRYVTFNLRHGGILSELDGTDDALEARLAIAAEALRALDADVIALQEASTGPRRGHVAARLAASLGYHYAYAPAAVRPFGSARAQRAVTALLRFTEGPAILSRFPIAAWEALPVPYCRRPFDTRVLLFAELLTPAGRLATFSAHISGDACMARAVAELVRARRGAAPAVVLGDFNAVEDAEPIRLLTREAGFVDAFRVANPGAPGFTAGQDVAAPRPTASRRIDYVFLVPGGTRASRVAGSRVVLRAPRPDGAVLWPSDHYGVLADLEFERAAPPLVAGGEGPSAATAAVP
jgi:endonuclease/exonuclease/phosphatase family metal-dependent hydrolase